jgi:hypothetical protein
MTEPPVLDGLDPALRDLVTAALDKDPRRRPTAHDLLARLTGRTDRPAPPREETRQDTASARGAGSGRRRRLLIGAGAVAAVAAVGGATALYAFRDSNAVPGNTRSIFTDDFSSQQSGWGKRAYIPGPVIGYGFKGGGYGLDAGGGNPVRLRMSPVTREQMPEPVLASVTVKAVQGPPYGMFGLICAEQYDNGASGYRFLVRRDGRGALVRKVTKAHGSKELLRLDEGVEGFDANGPNRVQIACEPDRDQIWLRMWVNGELAADIGDTDRPMLKGNVGLIAAQETGATELRVDFDDFEMAEILY